MQVAGLYAGELYAKVTSAEGSVVIGVGKQTCVAAAMQLIVAKAAIQRVPACTTVEAVVAFKTIDDVVAISAMK